MRVWRLSRVPLPGPTFDGEGARLFPGRWNNEGVPVVYTSEHLSLAIVELFVHLEPRHLRRAYYSFRVDIDDALLETVAERHLPPNWDAEEAPESTRDLGSAWARSGRSLGLVVPSVVVPGERNVVLNTQHPRFATLVIEGPARFEFDRRMTKGPGRTRRTGGRFKLSDRSWGSGGLRPEFRGASWEQIRDASYEGRGT